MTTRTSDAGEQGAPRTTRDGDHVWITMARPSRRNALSHEHLAQLLDWRHPVSDRPDAHRGNLAWVKAQEPPCVRSS